MQYDCSACFKGGSDDRRSVEGQRRIVHEYVAVLLERGMERNRPKTLLDKAGLHLAAERIGLVRSRNGSASTFPSGATTFTLPTRSTTKMRPDPSSDGSVTKRPFDHVTAAGDGALDIDVDIVLRPASAPTHSP
jgi:hypothetical protein